MSTIEEKFQAQAVFNKMISETLVNDLKCESEDVITETNEDPSLDEATKGLIVSMIEGMTSTMEKLHEAALKSVNDTLLDKDEVKASQPWDNSDANPLQDLEDMFKKLEEEANGGE